MSSTPSTSSITSPAYHAALSSDGKAYLDGLIAYVNANLAKEKIVHWWNLFYKDHLGPDATLPVKSADEIKKWLELQPESLSDYLVPK